MMQEERHREVDSGKTFRKRREKERVQYDPELRIDRDWNYISSDSSDCSKRVAITDIDEKFKFVSHSDKFINDGPIQMNNVQLGHDLLEELMPYHYRINYSRWEQGREMIFKVPIKDYITITDIRSDKKNNMISYHGKMYDPNKIYIITEMTTSEDSKWKRKLQITELCDSNMNHPDFPDDKITNLGSCSIEYRIDINNEGHFEKSYFDHGYGKISMSGRRGWSQEYRYNKKGKIIPPGPHKVNLDQEIIIDMKNVKYLTHVGILPDKIDADRISLSENINDRYVYWRNRGGGLMGATDINNQSWVNGINVWYKIKSSDNWISLGQWKSSGCCHKMNLIDLISNYNCQEGMKCRYFKFVVTSFNHYPVFEVQFYGKRDSSEIAKEKERIADKKYVEYSISRCIENNLPEKYVKSSGYDWGWTLKDSRTKKKKKIFGHHELCMKYDNDDDDDDDNDDDDDDYDDDDDDNDDDDDDYDDGDDEDDYEDYDDEDDYDDDDYEDEDEENNVDEYDDDEPNVDLDEWEIM
jgi:hypothetical protein